MKSFYSDPFEIPILSGGGGAGDPALGARVSALENEHVKARWFYEIGTGTSGTITPPSGGTILLDQWGMGVDAVVSTVTHGMPPDFVLARTAGGVVISATLDVEGNWTLSGTPAAYPVALIYAYQVKFKDFDAAYSLVEGKDFIDYTPEDAANKRTSFQLRQVVFRRSSALGPTAAINW